jgi:hypothetical protein
MRNPVENQAQNDEWKKAKKQQLWARAARLPTNRHLTISTHACMSFPQPPTPLCPIIAAYAPTPRHASDAVALPHACLQSSSHSAEARNA